MKNLLFLTTFFLVFGTLIFGPLRFNGAEIVEETQKTQDTQETQDSEVKLEGEKEELLTTKHLVEIQNGLFLSHIINFPDFIFNDYVVHLGQEVKPPRPSSFLNS